MRFQWLVSAAAIAFLAAELGVSTVHASTALTGINLGTAAPPARIGSYTMTPFPLDLQPGGGAPVTSVASPLGGLLGFSPNTDHRRIGSGWASWSHGYTGDVYYNNGASTQTLTMPANTGAFYVYVEGNSFTPTNFTMVATNEAGATSTVGPMSIVGQSGAAGVGFFSSGSPISSILITNTDGAAGGFSVGEFGIAQMRAAGAGQYIGPDGGSWFTPAHWASGTVPTAITDVFVSADIVIDQPGAQADDVVVLSGSALTIAGGALQAQSITVDAGSTLALVGEASLLQTVDLELQPSAELEWNGGTIRILGGTLALPPGDLVVGDSPVLSRLELLGGASCSVNGHFFVGMDATDEGEVLLADGSSLSVSGNTTIGSLGSGSMTVESGSSLTCGGSGTTISLHPGSIGTMTITDPGSTWVNTGDIEVSGIDGDALLQIAGGANVASGRGWIARTPGAVGAVTIIGLGSKWTCNDRFFAGGWPFGPGGDATVTVGSAATLRVLGAELRVWPEGEIRGSGLVDAGFVLCSGLLRPGSAIGSLTCGGNVTLDANGELSIGLAGTGEGQFDRLLIGGTASLGGQLTIAPLSSFVPQPGQSFGVLSASQINGEFDFVDGIGQSCGDYVVEYTSSSVTVSVEQGGDLNCDGIINTLDLGILLAFWGPVGLYPLADINDDGTVDTLDLGILLSNWTL